MSAGFHGHRNDFNRHDYGQRRGFNNSQPKIVIINQNPDVSGFGRFGMNNRMNYNGLPTSPWSTQNRGYYPEADCMCQNHGYTQQRQNPMSQIMQMAPIALLAMMFAKLMKNDGNERLQAEQPDYESSEEEFSQPPIVQSPETDRAVFNKTVTDPDEWVMPDFNKPVDAPAKTPTPVAPPVQETPVTPAQKLKEDETAATKTETPKTVTTTTDTKVPPAKTPDKDKTTTPPPAKTPDKAKTVTTPPAKKVDTSKPSDEQTKVLNKLNTTPGGTTCYKQDPLSGNLILDNGIIILPDGTQITKGGETIPPEPSSTTSNDSKESINKQEQKAAEYAKKHPNAKPLVYKNGIATNGVVSIDSEGNITMYGKKIDENGNEIK